jgi:predicted alpha/beta-hydrolase family hydrolase
MKAGPFRIALESGKVTAIAYPAARAVRATLLLAHGAGAGQRHPYMAGTAERLRARGVTVVTFDFPYMENGKKLPDKGDALEACFRVVYEAVRARAPESLFVGGKSMGGRIATQVAAKGEIAPAGLVLLGYPLHPPGKPTQRRDAHLPKVRPPMLFVQGTRDAFGTPAEIAPLLPTLAKRSVLLPVEGGDHSHAVPKAVMKSAGLSPDAVLASIADAIVEWMTPLAR